jgi:hypothetical protein
MNTSEISRRGFLAAAAAPLAIAQSDWVELFNGRDLTGWKPSENLGSWKVNGGLLAADGPRSHLFYTGPVRGGVFKNFELEAEVMTRPGANSGIFFHTAFQDKGWPEQGFEIQVNNTATGEGSYRERKKTASLYGVRNVYKQFVPDGEWFKLHVVVRGKRVEVRLNGMLAVDFVEATPPVLAEGSQRGRVLGQGTFALQCHDPGSKAFYRRLRVRPLPDEAPAVPAPAVDDTYRRILTLGANNYPMVDFHVHLKTNLTLEQALERSYRDGIMYGIAVNCGKGHTIETNDGARKFHASMQGQPIFVAMQAEGREWTQMFSRETAALFDYVFTDSMTWSDNNGKRMRLWMPGEVGTISDAQAFMDLLVERTVGILEQEPVDIYVNPTFIPDSIAKDYDTLWTEPRMAKVAQAAAKNGIAIELNNRYNLPHAAFVRLAKQAGCKFTFGTNNTGAADLRRCEHGLRMIEECKLGWQDFWAPGAFGSKAVERKGGVLKG